MPGNRRALTALRGFVYIDGGTHQITRIIYDADEIPSGFPILDDHTVLDYGDIRIGGEMFLLPVRSNLRMVSKSQISRNVTEFTNYRKFTVEVKMEFEEK